MRNAVACTILLLLSFCAGARAADKEEKGVVFEFPIKPGKTAFVGMENLERRRVHKKGANPVARLYPMEGFRVAEKTKESVALTVVVRRPDLDPEKKQWKFEVGHKTHEKETLGEASEIPLGPVGKITIGEMVLTTSSRSSATFGRETREGDTFLSPTLVRVPLSDENVRFFLIPYAIEEGKPQCLTIVIADSPATISKLIQASEDHLAFNWTDWFNVVGEDAEEEKEASSKQGEEEHAEPAEK